MSAIAPCTSAICVALLAALIPASADAAGNLTPVPLAAWQRPWTALPKLQLAPLNAGTVFPALPETSGRRWSLALDPAFATAWTTTPPRIPLQLELSSTTPAPTGSGNGEVPSGLNLPAQVPPLIRYTDETTDVTLSISPGSPCTGACLKLAGSF